MASEELYEVERIVDKREDRVPSTVWCGGKATTGRTSRGSPSSTGSTTRSTSKTSTSATGSDRGRASALPRASRASPSNARKHSSRSPTSGFSKSAPKAPVMGRDPESKSSALLEASQKLRRSTAPSLPGRKSMDLAKSGIKILVPKSPIKSRTAVEGFLS